MEGTAGADGTDVASTKEGGRSGRVGGVGAESEHNITLQHTCLYA